MSYLRGHFISQAEAALIQPELAKQGYNIPIADIESRYGETLVPEHRWPHTIDRARILGIVCDVLRANHHD